jgi:GTP1/Obg family GTP-binding protein
MAIEWDALIVEMTLLAAIIYGAIYVENWVEKRKARQKKKEEADRILEFVTNDLQKKLRFIEDTIQYKDFKPFFTDMWDAVILGGKQAVLSFEMFENLQHTYSWMKYYNNELDQRESGDVRGN